MRNVFRILPALVVVILIGILSRPIGALPALGTVLDPVNGLMAGAEAVDRNFDAELKLKGVRGAVEVWFEDRLVPHIRAGNDHDLYFTQGYVHAYFRLWQMDMQTRAAGGRVAEVAGEKAVEFDRGQRRKGMVFGAAKSLAAMEADPRTRDMLNAYRDGINAFIGTLNFRELPLEYKLMGFRPEKWTNLRSALLLKYMADDLTGKTDDIAFTLLREQLGEEQFDQLFPERIPGSIPVIPEGTKFEPPSLRTPPVPQRDVWAHFGGSRNKKSVIGKGHPFSAMGNEAKQGFSSLASNVTASGGTSFQPFSNNPPLTRQQSSNGSGDCAVGSNNWAISGARTASGKPILCNDPHLGLNLPSLWFEVQLTAPGINTYGVSLPGAPGVVIGYNDKISWGFTNNYRDVKDFYEIHPAGAGRKAYVFNGQEIPFSQKTERIGVKGGGEIFDTVLYTIHGPVMYDPSFSDPAKTGALLACTWMAHRRTNELLSLYLVNRAANYETFTQAIQHFECPAQNFVYADVAGNIAMWGQGRFINKWKDQGKFVMNGSDSTTLWGESIPMAENPHVLNPPQGYVVSANQQVTDSTYLYWYNGSFTEWRSWAINGQLENPYWLASVDTDARGSRDTQFIQSIHWLQNDERSLLADRVARYSGYDFRFPSPQSGSAFNGLSLDALSIEATTFQVWWSIVTRNLWQHRFSAPGLRWPSSEISAAIIRGDSLSPYFDDPETGTIERRSEFLARAFGETADSLKRLQRGGPPEWYQVKNTSLTHLAKLPAFSYDHLKIGGWGNTINAVSGNHGPSWRMIVEMDSFPKAYAIYPGGQSGNPGSKHYGDNVQQWVDGRYNELRFVPATVKTNPFRYSWQISG